MKKLARIIIICILIIGVIVTIIVLKNNKKDTSTISNDTNNYDLDDPWEGDDEVVDFEKEDS